MEKMSSLKELWDKIEAGQSLLFERAKKNVLLLVAVSFLMLNWLNPIKAYHFNPPKVKYGEVKNLPKPHNGFLIRILNEDGAFSCSGFVIDGRYAVTAAHCLEGMDGELTKKPIIVHNDKDKDTKVNAKPFRINSRADIGLIEGDFRDYHGAFFNDTIEGFEGKGPFVSCGFPWGSKTAYCGKVKVKKDYYEATEGLGVLKPGMSGGPVIDWTAHAVVGVNSYMREEKKGFMSLLGFRGIFDLE